MRSGPSDGAWLSSEPNRLTPVQEALAVNHQALPTPLARTARQAGNRAAPPYHFKATTGCGYLCFDMSVRSFASPCGPNGLCCTDIQTVRSSGCSVEGVNLASNPSWFSSSTTA
jgi:hypothetical protein